MPGMAPCLLLGESEAIYKPPLPAPLLCSPGTGTHSPSCCLQSCSRSRAECSRITESFGLEKTSKILKSNL